MSTTPYQIWCHSSPVTILPGNFEAHSEPRSLIRFSGPIREEWKSELGARGIKIEFWTPPFGACVTLPTGLHPADLKQFSFIEGEIGYTEKHCQRTVPAHSEEQRRRTGLPGDLVDLVCFNGAVRPEVEAQLRVLGVQIVDSSSSKIRVRYSGDLSVLRDLEGVKLADPARGSVVLDESGLAVALAAAAPTADWLPGLDGRGEIVAVADTGLDVGVDGPDMHPDFRGRIAFIASWPINPSWNDTVVHPGHDDGAADLNTGHGTHVAALAVGDGSVGHGAHRGVAPGAHLVFQAMEQFCEIKPEAQGSVQPGFYLSGRPLDIRQLFRQARDQGARIHVNSWGDAAAGAYTSDCFEADLFLHENRDAVVLFAAGNDGADRDQDGRIDPGSLYAPASAKNVIAVGATEGPLNNVGLRGTWARFDPSRQRFTTLSDRTDPISGEPDRIAPFSSTGPTVDGRIKPDVCAPGTNLAAAKSRVCAGTGWGLADPLPSYMYDGGTSTATGVTGGLMASLRQAWRDANGGNAPSGAALKAILILGAQPVRGREGFSSALPQEAGYGCVNLAASLPPASGGKVLLFGDDDPGLKTGDERLYKVNVPADASVRAVLCWYDSPGERLINALDLFLVAADGTAISSTTAPARINTVEILNVKNLPAGEHVFKVGGFNVPDSPQTFALAVSIGT
jgi:hypothetical protein